MAPFLLRSHRSKPRKRKRTQEAAQDEEDRAREEAELAARRPARGEALCLFLHASLWWFDQ